MAKECGKETQINSENNPSADVSGLVNAAKAHRRSKIYQISFLCFLGAVIFAVMVSSGLLFVKNHFDQVSNLKFDPNNGLLLMSNSRGLEALKGYLGKSFGHSLYKKKVRGDSLFYEWENTVTLRVSQESERCFVLKWGAGNSDLSTFTDCYELKGSHWYGGAEIRKQVWPLEKAELEMKPFLPMNYLQAKNTPSYGYGAVLERYWLNSKGIALLLNESVPLHVSWNEKGDGKFCLKADRQGYPASNLPHHIAYRLCSGKHANDTHSYIVKTFFQLPVDIPDINMIKQPIWSTWGRYQKAVNQSVVLSFAKEIEQHGFPYSQIDIGNTYSTRYGDFDFDPVKFSNPRVMIDQLHSQGFQVSVWVHPFANTDSKAFQSGMRYWVKQIGGDVLGIVEWWNGAAAVLDTTSLEAQSWFTERLKAFRTTYGFDSFNFDAGEVNYLPIGYELASIPYSNPAYYSYDYVTMASTFGQMVKVRVGYKSQGLPLFVRILDRDSVWDENNGLRSLIPTVLTFGILGFPFVLPDVVGGNAFCSIMVGKKCFIIPDKELYIRWLQASVFLPSLQFAVPPWDYDNETVIIAKNMVSLRIKISNILVKLAKGVIETGAPVIRPLWWLAPDDVIAQKIDSQFLVGDAYLIAPVLRPMKESRGRHNVYLPRGKWQEEFGTKKVFEVKEGKWLKYKLKLEDLPYYSYISGIN